MTEYCSAGSVATMMKICDTTLSEDQISVVCKDVLNALVYLHRLGEIHQNIKAGNVLSFVPLSFLIDNCRLC